MKKEYIIIIFLLLGPILDVTSFLGSSISIVVRGMFLAGVILYEIGKKKEYRVIVPLFIFSVISFLYQFLCLQLGFMASISSIFKFLYLPITVVFFRDYIFPVSKEKIFTIILCSYIGIYLFSYITGLGADNYLVTDGKSGFKGLFSSINEFSAILVCLLPIVCSNLKNKKKYILLILLIGASFLTSLLIGTKILLGGILFTIFYLCYQERKKLFFDRTNIQKTGIIISFIIVILFGCLLFPKTRTYQNMIIQKKFFQVENVFSIEFVNKVVFNDRLTFLQNNFEYFKKQSIPNQLMGIGISNGDIKLVEIDFFDILFRYGILGIIIFIGSILFIKKNHSMKIDEKIGIILLIFVSFTSGHVIIYPAVSIYFAALYAKSKV